MDNINELRLADIWPAMEEQLNNGKSVKFQPRGTSMLPMLRPGVDSVLLKKAPSVLKCGDVPLYIRADGHFVLHRIIIAKKGRYTMCGDNQKKLEYNIFSEQILAVTEGIYRGNKYISCKNLIYRFYSFFRVKALKTYVFPMRAMGKIKRIIKKSKKL